MSRLAVRGLIVLAMAAMAAGAFAQAECNGWGDFRGIRLGGELVRFDTSLRMASPGWSEVALTATERVGNPKFIRTGLRQEFSGSIAFADNRELSFRQTVEDAGPGLANVIVEATAGADLDLAGVYYFINLPGPAFAQGTVQLIGVGAEAGPAMELDAERAAAAKEFLHGSGRGVRLAAAGRQIEVMAAEPKEFIVKPDRFVDTDIVTQEGLRLESYVHRDGLIAVYFPLGEGNLAKGRTVKASFSIKVSGPIDNKPAKLALNMSKPGPPFAGIGGNFRLQSPADPASIAFNLENIRVAWGRVELPLSAWQPSENAEPSATTDTSKLNRNVRGAMEMARTLAQKKIPFVISDWQAPRWAIVPQPRRAPGAVSIPAQRIIPEKWPALYKAIGSYLLYMKEHYGAEPDLFSLNESDLGINILQTPEEHSELIKGLGAHLASLGLKTKMLLGDACSPHPVKFIDAAMSDTEARKFIGGVSYHSWHDGTDEEFLAWGSAAQKLGVPLLIGEAGTDADAYKYPAIFDEGWFALNEADTNVRIMALSRAASILHWQLTDNYSILAGGRGGEPLRPGRRFWQLKQLNLTPPGLPSVDVASDTASISCCAYASPSGGVALHLVNNGARRRATISGLPAALKELHQYITDADRGMAEAERIPVSGGAVSLEIETQAMITLAGQP